MSNGTPLLRSRPQIAQISQIKNQRPRADRTGLVRESRAARQKMRGAGENINGVAMLISSEGTFAVAERSSKSDNPACLRN
jgi:hypothetical protein